MMISSNAQKAEEQGIKLAEGSNAQPYYMRLLPIYVHTILNYSEDCIVHEPSKDMHEHRRGATTNSMRRKG